MLNASVRKELGRALWIFVGEFGLGARERWFAARVQPRRETTAQVNLDRQGFRNFAPKVRRTVRHARTLRNVLAPLFPGYIFVVLNLSIHRWRVVNNTVGVASLIMGAEQPTPVPTGIVEALVTATEASGLIRFDRDVEIGDKVRILSGPFAEALCRLVHLDEKGRVRVLLEIMGGPVPVELERWRVAPAA